VQKVAEEGGVPEQKEGLDLESMSPATKAVAFFAAAAAVTAASDPALAADAVVLAADAAGAAADAAGAVAAAATEAATTAAAATSEAAAATSQAAAATSEAATAAAGDAAGAAADVADAAGAAADAGSGKVDDSGDWFEPIVNFNAGIIAGIDDVIENKLKIPNTFGAAIIAYTVLIKAVTFPLNQSSLRTNAMMQLIAPKVKQIQAKYENDQETANRMLLRLYDDCGVNPLGGCLPSLIQFPIFISLYRAITKLAQKNEHFQEPFLWIPSLAGPVESGKPSLDWLLKSKSAESFEPLVGWHDAGCYIILPVALVASQFITQRTSNPTQNQGGPLAALLGLFPLIIGYTSLVSPAGLGIYWFFNNTLTQAQTQLIRKGLGEEFPEYRKILEGQTTPPAEKKAEEPEPEEQPVISKGFGMAPPVAAAPAEEEEAEVSQKEVATGPTYNDPAAGQRRARSAAKRRSRSSRRRR